MHGVQLAVSALGSLGGMRAYHSSVLVDGDEFSFSGSEGIIVAHGTPSHQTLGGRPHVFKLGSSRHCGRELLHTLRPYFRPGTYDLIRKNCISFVDCALFFLLGHRLDRQFIFLQRIASLAPTMLQLLSGGLYEPNPMADGFDCERLICRLEPGLAPNRAMQLTARWQGLRLRAPGPLVEAVQAALEAVAAALAGPCGCQNQPQEDPILALSQQSLEEASLQGGAFEPLAHGKCGARTEEERPKEGEKSRLAWQLEMEDHIFVDTALTYALQVEEKAAAAKPRGLALEKITDKDLPLRPGDWARGQRQAFI